MSRSPLSRRLQRRLFRLVNVPMRFALGLSFPTPMSRRLMLLTFTGRRSGRTYRQPVSYVRDGDTLLTPGGGAWTRNLAGGREATVRLRGRDTSATADLVTDLDEVERLLGVISTDNPTVKAFVGIPKDANGRLVRDRLAAAVEHGFCIVRWHLAPTGPVL